MTPTRPQAVRRQTAPPSCARPGRVRDPSPHEPVSTRTLKKEKRQGRSLPLTRKNVALLAAVDRLLEFGPGGEFCYFAGRNLDCGSVCGLRPLRAFLCETEKVPKPISATRSPFFSAAVMLSRVV